jgi:phage terminase small subunit
MPVLKNARHERFIQGVVKGISPGPAYTAAGYEVTGNSAESAAARLFRNVQVKERYAELMAPAIEATGATVERVLKEMVRLAFYDMTEILAVDDDGKVTQRDPTSLPEDLRRAIVAIKPIQIGDTRTWEVKFADKQKALDSLARYLQMFKDTLVVENVFRVVQEMDDDELDRRLAELERAYNDAKTLDPPTGEGPKSIH